MKALKNQLPNSKFLSESLESKWLGKQIVNIVFNFDRTFQRFRRYYPNCPFIDVINDKITVMYEIIDELKNEKNDTSVLKRLLSVLLKLVWTMDKEMVKYMKEEEDKIKNEEQEKNDRIDVEAHNEQ